MRYAFLVDARFQRISVEGGGGDLRGVVFKPNHFQVRTFHVDIREREYYEA